MKQSLLLTLLFSIVVLTLTGCGKENKALITYKDEMTAFCNDIQEQNNIINSIDPASESATNDLLAALDTLNEKFTYLANMNVPKQFSSIESLADEAGSYMSEAVSMYHEVFEAEPFDATTIEVANENYGRAIKRVQYIGDILMGKIPDGENVTITDEDSEASYPEDTPAEDPPSESATTEVAE